MFFIQKMRKDSRMSEKKVVQGAIEIMDNKGEITIPDIANEHNYYLSLFHRSGFERTIITDGSNREGYPVSLFQFCLAGGKKAQELKVTNYSNGDSVSYHFKLIFNGSTLNKRQGTIVLYYAMNMILYGKHTNKKIMTKELMDGTEPEKEDLVILEY